MAMTEADRTDFQRRMAEYDSSHGIERAAGGSDLDPSVSSRDTFGLEAQARAEWQRSPAIRAEFVELGRYIAFVKADARGLVRILSRSRNA